MSAHQGDLESHSTPGEITWIDRAAAGVAAGTAGAALGAGVDPSLAPTVALFVTPVATEVLNAILSRNSKAQFAKAGGVLAVAADVRQVAPDQLAGLADNPSEESLLATALRAGANSAMPAKIVALGKVLADGLAHDDVTVDEATMLADAFGDIEVAHVRVLDYLVGDDQYPPRGRPRAVTLVEFLEANPGYRTSISPIVATLERHGIIRPVGQPQEDMVWQAEHLLSIQLLHRYRVTVFGHELLARLREAVDGPRVTRGDQ